MKMDKMGSSIMLAETEGVDKSILQLLVFVVNGRQREVS